MSTDTIRKPVITLEETILSPMHILTIPDTAKSMEEIGLLIGKDYGELFAFINQQQLQPGKVLAFYYSSEVPFVMDVAVEVNKLPQQLTGRIKAKEIEGGKAIVAHYQGPYEQIAMAYAELNNWIKKNNKEQVGLPFESYLNDPYSVKDPWELRTDIYQRIK
jgi:effector-binding domain-containing protein